MKDLVQQLYRDPAEYDLEHAAVTEDIPFWIEAAKRYKAQWVLELAVGTGRVAIPLARAGLEHGFSVVGLDLAPGMLARCREKLAQEEQAVQNNLTLHEGDMRRFEMEQQFDLVFIGLNTARHLLTLEDRVATFASAHRHLALGGRLMLDLSNLGLFLLVQAQERRPRLDVDLDLEEQSLGQRLLRTVANRYDETTQTLHTRWFVEKYREGVQREKRMQDVSLHNYFPEELRVLFLLSGLTVEDVYGDFDWRPFTAGCRRMIFVGRKL